MHQREFKPVSETLGVAVAPSDGERVVIVVCGGGVGIGCPCESGIPLDANGFTHFS